MKWFKMEGNFKGFAAVCILFSQLNFSFSGEPPIERTAKNVELSWRIGRFHAEREYELTNNKLRTLEVLDSFDCVTACLEERRCCSANYKQDDIPICELNKRCRRKNVEEGCLKKSERTTFYEISDGNGRSAVEEDSCSSSPCLNGGSCILTSACNGYKCTCHAFNTGEHCEKWKDGAYDFDLTVFFSSDNSKKGFASFNFGSTHFSSAKPWHGFSVCFWAKLLSPSQVDGSGSKTRYLSYFNADGGLVIRVEYEDDKDEITFLGLKAEKLATVKVQELKDREWHFICAMWENTAGKGWLFVDGAMRVRSQGKCIGGTVSWDGLFVLGDRRDVNIPEFTCILTCVRLWEGTIKEEEVKKAYADKKCEDNDRVSVPWPWFKMAELEGEAVWSNSSSLTKEDLDFEIRFPQETTGSPDYIIVDSFPFPELKDFTVCLWEHSPEQPSGTMSLVSYSVSGVDKALIVDMKEDTTLGYLTLTVWIDKIKGSTPGLEDLNNKFWNHHCLTWSNTVGGYKFYYNGTLNLAGVFLKKSHQIPRSGSLVIGGQMSSGELTNRFQGVISCLQMWSSPLSSEKIKAIFDTSTCVKLYEPFFNWNEVQNGKTVGNVTWSSPSSITTYTEVSKEDFDAEFPTRSTDGYIVFGSPRVSLSALTVVMWAKPYSCSNVHYLLIYSTSKFENEILFKLEESSSLCKWSITMKSVELASKTLQLNDDDWHFVAFSWESSSGTYKFWLDSVTVSESGKFQGEEITVGGKIVIGEQEKTDANSTKNRFTGRVSCTQMWTSSLTDAQVSEIYNKKRSPDCACQSADDSLFTWAQVKTATVKGEVTLQSPSGIRP